MCALPPSSAAHRVCVLYPHNQAAGYEQLLDRKHSSETL